MVRSEGRTPDFDTIYRQAYPLVVRTVYLVVFDRDVAQEITHEAFLRLWQHRDRLDDAANQRAWLMRVAVNLAIDHRRNWLSALKHRLLPVPAPDPGALAIQRLDIEAMRSAILRLRPRDRAILALRYEQGLSFPEIGRLLDRPEATVKTRLHRALAQLHRQIAGPVPHTAALEEIP